MQFLTTSRKNNILLAHLDQFHAIANTVGAGRAGGTD